MLDLVFVLTDVIKCLTDKYDNVETNHSNNDSLTMSLLNDFDNLYKKTRKINKNDIAFRRNIYIFFNNLGFNYQLPGKIRSFNYEKTNDYYLYSSVIIQNKGTIMIQPIIRISDYNSPNPFTLNRFSMISLGLKDKNMKTSLDLIG